MGYESLFTMFPQMWINETKRKRGEKLEDQSHNYYRSFRLTLFEKKFKYFFRIFFQVSRNEPILSLHRQD
jgi:hypothetical protein